MRLPVFHLGSLTKKNISAFLFLFLAFLAAPFARAQTTYYWDTNDATTGFGTAGGTWAAPTTNNSTQGWSTSAAGTSAMSGTTTTNATDALNFGTGSAGLSLGTITVSGTVNANSLTFGSASGNITLSGGTITLGGTTPTITTNNTADTISSVLAGSAGMTKNGTGSLILTGANTYTGATTVNAGTLRVTYAGAVYSASTANFTVNATGILALNGANSTFNPVVNLNGGTLLSDENGGYVITKGVNVTSDSILQTSGTGTTGFNSQLFADRGINISSGVTLTYNPTTLNSGIVVRYNASSSGSLVINGVGTGSNTGRANLQFAAQDSGSSNFANTDLTLTNATMNVGKGTNGDTNSGATIKSLNGNGKVWADTTASTLTVGANNGNGSFSGVLANGNATLSLTKSGTGTQTLSGNNTYTGATTISAGTLKAGSSTGISSSSAVSVAAGATLDLGGFNNTISSLSTGTGTITNSGASANLTITSVGSGAAQLFTGNMALVLNTSTAFTNANSTYSGGTYLTNGRIIWSGNIGVGTPGALTNGIYGTGAFTIGNSAQLYFQGGQTFNNAIVVNSAAGESPYLGAFRIAGGGAMIAGAINANLADATFNAVSGSQSASVTGAISGNSGVHIMTQGGTLNVTLNSTANANTYAGNTTINGTSSTLTLGASDQIPNGVGKGNLINSGTFAMGGFSETINGLSGNGTIDGNGATLTVGDNDATSTFSGVIKNTTGSLGLTKTGNGTLTLSGISTYAGATTVSGGTLSLTGNLSGGTAISVGGASVFTQGSASIISGTSSFTQNSSGTSTLAGANTYNGTTTLKAGQLNLNHATAIGTGTLTITGGTIDNTSAAAITLTNNNAQNWNGNFTFAGTKDLNMGTGAVTMNASRTVTVSNGNFTVGGNISGSTFGLTKNGSGTMILTGANTYSGATTVNAGTLSISGNISSSALTLNSGGIISAGNSTDVKKFTTSALTIAGGSGYVFTIGNATGSAGTDYDQIYSTGALSFSNTAANPFTVYVSGNATGWSNNSTYTWNIISTGSAGNLSGYNLANFTVNLNSFGVASGNRTGTWDFGSAGGNITLTYAVATPDLIWNGGTGNWNDTYTANLTGFTPAKPTTDKNLIFTGSGGTVTNNIVSGNLSSLNYITFNSTAGSYTLAAAAGSAGASGGTPLTVRGDIVNNSANAQTIAMNLALGLSSSGLISTAAGNITISGVISGSGALNKSGNSTLILTGANTYTGITTIVAGTLQIGAGGTTGSLSTSSAINNSGTLVFNRSNTITQGTDFASVISGTGSFIQNGSGTLVLSGANTYSGLTTLNTGTLALNNATALGTGTLTITGGTLDNTSGSAKTITNTNAQNWNGNFTFAGSNDLNMGTGAVTMNASRTVTVTAGNFTVGGIISGSTLGLTKNGSGTMILSGANTYNGTTTINAGTLKANGGSAIADTSAVSVTSGAEFNIGANEVVGSIAGAGNITLSTFTLTAGVDNSSTTFSGILSGTGGGLTKNGTGILTLSGNNTYTGTTTINAGTLQIGAGGTTGSLSTSSAINNSGTLVFNRSNTITQGTDFASVISGTGSLTQNGSGTLVLSGANTYSGLTTLNTGTLALNNATALGTGTLTITGGTLDNTSGSTKTLSNNNTQNWNGSFTFAGSNNLNMGTGAVTMNASRTVTVTAGNFTVGGIISGSPFGLTKNGSGTMILSGANTYNGTTTINAGTLKANGGSAIADTSAVSVTSGGEFNIGANETVGSIAGGGNITLGSYALTAGGDNSNTTFSGILSGTGSLSKNGTGTLTLSGANTYTGATTVNAGTLSIAAITNGGVVGALGNSTNAAANLVLGGGTLLYTGSNGSSDRNFTLTASTTSAINVSTSSTQLTISGTSASTNGSLTKTGSGTLLLTGENLHSGTTTVSAGTLAISGNISSSALSLSSGGIISAGNSTDVKKITVGSLTIAGGSGYNWTLANATDTTAGSGFDQIYTAGALALNNTSASPFTVYVYGNATGWDGTAKSWNIISAASQTGFNSGNFAVNLNSFGIASANRTGTWSFNATGGNISLNYAVSTGNYTWVGGTGNWTDAYTSGTAPGFTEGVPNANDKSLVFSGNSTATVTNTVSNGTVSSVNFITFSGNASSSYTLAAAVGSAGAAGGTPLTVKGDIINNSSNATGQTISAALAFGSGSTGIINTAAGNITISGVISGSGGLTKNGSSTLILSGANTYAGATTINAGTLTANGGSAIANASAVSVGSGAVFNLGASETVGSIAGAGNITLGSYTLTAGGDNSSTIASGVISGTGALAKTGTGALTLSGANTYNGTTTVSAGTLKAGSNTGMSSASTLTVNGGAFDLNGFNATVAYVGAGAAAGTITNTASGSGTNTLTISNYNVNLASLITDGATAKTAVTMNSAGANVLSNANNTFSGGLTLANNNTRLYQGSVTSTLDGTTLTKSNLGTGTIYIGANGSVVSAQLMLSSGLVYNNIIVNANNYPDGGRAAFRIDGTVAFYGTLTAGATDISLSSGSTGTATAYGQLTGTNGLLLKTPGTSFTLTLANTANAANNYSGNTTIQANTTLALGAADQISNGVGKGNLSNNGTFNLGGFSETINGLSGNGTIDGVSGTPTLTVGDNDATSSFSGVIKNTTGNLSLTKTGNGTLTLSGANTYNGTTTISAGTLTVSGTGQLGGGSYAGAISNAGTFNYASTANQTLSGIMSGTGALTKDGASNLTLAGVNTYTGATTITAGTLTIGGAGQLGSGSYSGNIANSGTFIYGSTANQTLSGTISGTGALTKNGTGTLTLSGSNSYSGGTTLNTGTLVIGHAAAAGTGTITQSSGSSLLKFDTTGTITNAMSVYNVLASQSATLSGAITVNNATWDIETGDTLTISGAVSGSGGVTKNGGGTLTLNGTNTYNGSTVVNAGTLNANSTNALGSNNTVQVNGGTLLVTADDAINGKNIELGGSGVGLRFSGTYNGSIGLLTLNANSIIDLGTDPGGVIARFSDIDFKGYNLSFYNWKGQTLWGGTNRDNTDQVYIMAPVTPEELDRISFYSSNGGDSFLGTGFELGFSSGFADQIIPVPEPETYATGLLLLLGSAWWMWKRKPKAV